MVCAGGREGRVRGLIATDVRSDPRGTVRLPLANKSLEKNIGKTEIFFKRPVRICLESPWGT